MSNMDFETQMRSIAQELDYPRTPDVAGPVLVRIRSSANPRFPSKTLAWSLTLIVVLCSSLMLIPPARAAILEFIQIGIVRIFPRSGTPTVQAPATATLDSSPRETVTPAFPPFDSLPAFSRIAGETTLSEAQSAVTYPILVPSYPPDLGDPDHVFVQDAAGTMTILVWSDSVEPEKVILSLHFIPEGSWVVRKMEPAVLQLTKVNGQRAIWTEGPYFLQLDNGYFELTRLIEGHVLIWTEGSLTLRLETGLSVEEAVKIAESLQPIP